MVDTMTSPVRRWLPAFVSFGAITALFALIPWREVAGNLIRCDPTWALAGAVSMAIAWVLMAEKWQALVPTSLSKRDALVLTLRSLLYGFLLPGQVAGDAFRTYVFARRGVLALGLASVVLDRVLGLAALLTLGLAGAFSQQLFLHHATFASVITIFGGGWVACMIALGITRRTGASMAIGEVGGAVGHLLRALRQSRAIPTTALVRSFGLSLAFQAICLVAVYCLGRAVGVMPGIAAWAWIFALASIVLLLPFSVGGIGLREGIFVALLAICGITRDAALAFSLLLTAVSALGALFGAAVELHKYSLRTGRRFRLLECCIKILTLRIRRTAMPSILLEAKATEDNFNESGYLAANPDVAAAVGRGEFRSGRHHFDTHGHHEGRLLQLPNAALAETKARKLARLRPFLRTDLPSTTNECGVDFLSESLRKQFNIVDTDAVSSNDYDGHVLGLIDRYKDGLVLDCGAGKRARYFDNVVNFEIVAYDTTDVRGVGEALPFIDNTFDAVISIAVLEHVKDPFRCAAEIARVLKPGGELICCVPFLQPYHGYPHHYYNMTHQGLRNLFEPRIAVDRIEVYESVGPIWTLTWIARSWAEGLSGEAREAFLDLRLRDLIAPPQQFLSAPFVRNLPPAKNLELASACVLFGRKS